MSAYTLGKSIFFIVLVVITGIVTTSVTYGLFPTIELNRLLTVIAVIVLIPFGIFLIRIIDVKKQFYLLTIAYVTLFLIATWNKSIFADLACDSGGSRTVEDIANAEILSDGLIPFCGYLQKCTYRDVESQSIQYEVCLVSDIWDESKQLQFYNIRLTNADDPLVQISNESHLLGELARNTLIINIGLGLTKEKICIFGDDCNDQNQMIPTLFGNMDIWKLVNSSQQ